MLCCRLDRTTYKKDIAFFVDVFLFTLDIRLLLAAGLYQLQLFSIPYLVVPTVST